MGLLSTIRSVVERLRIPKIVVDWLKLPNTPAVWFTGAIVLVGVISWNYVTKGGPDPPSIVYVCCILALASLISIWCTVLGGWRAYVIGVPAILLDGWALTVLGPSGEWLLYFLPLAIAIPCCVTVEMLKLMFGKFAKLLPDEQVFEEGLQFKLSHMFIVTTMVAVLFGIASGDRGDFFKLSQ